MNNADRDFNRVREMAGPTLSVLHEHWRVEALKSLENADTEELRFKFQTIAVVHRDLAAQWRDDLSHTRDAVLNADSAHNPEGDNAL